MMRSLLARRLPETLVDELLAAYVDAKRNFRMGGLRLSAIEGGRFCEAAFRMLEHQAWGAHTPIGRQVNSDQLIGRLSQLKVGDAPESIRLHIPRSLRVVYDIRNKRDAAHLGDGIDPNLQDGMLVVSLLDWVLAEFIRLHHDGQASDAARLIRSIVQYETPLVQDFDGHLKVLDPKLKAGDVCLILLYSRAELGATLDELRAWVRPAMRNNLRRTLSQLDDLKALVHFDGSRYFLTETGVAEVHSKRMFLN
jgi:hypothetical protein